MTDQNGVIIPQQADDEQISSDEVI